MRAKSFFYVTLGVLALAIAYHAGTTGAEATIAAAAPTEVAALSGVLPHGAVIPLPVFGDGTPASEAECHWIVAPEYANAGGGSIPFVCYASASAGGDPAIRGRVVSCFTCSPDWPNPVNGTASPGKVNFLIIATRGVAPTPATTPSFGALKARYR